ncbi:chorismate--pyruvate lyase family protein [Pseudoalteromonas fenneropenaei]|uniref:Chorismate--pyruvate lyase family protein n=1 Tax=Pseudoalteromonas fenneropenaei TaxID=1737459 RepID=A0ABV7CJH8_9GAMM
MITLTNHNLANQGLGSDVSHYNEQHLTHLQKIILGNDGTITQLIENIVGETLVVNKLFEGDLGPYQDHNTPVNEVLRCQRRIITLNGTSSGLPYLFADSLVFHDNLNVNFSRALLETKIPIGRAWEKYRVETYKTMLAWGFEPAGSLALQFNIDPQDLVLYRTYLVYSQGKRIFQITEKFPYAWFQDSQQLTSNHELPSLISGI